MTSLTSRAHHALTAREHTRAAAELARAARGAESRRRDLAHAAASLASLLGVDVAQVSATDDPRRRYYLYPYGKVPGMLLVLTEPDQHSESNAAPATPATAVDAAGSDSAGVAAGARFEFIRNPAGHVYLLGGCQHCAAVVPTARIRELADLGRALSPHPAPPPQAMGWDPHHVPGCPRRRLDTYTPTATCTTALPPEPNPTPPGTARRHTSFGRSSTRPREA